MANVNVLDYINDLEIKHTTDIEELQSTKVNISALLNLIYPVGSIYFSVNNVSPQTFIGGTWEQIKDRFLLCSGSSYSAGSTGGTANHNHKYGFRFGGYYRDIALENANGTGALTGGVGGSANAVRAVGNGKITAEVNNNSTTGVKSLEFNAYESITTTSNTSNMPPYLAVYVWKRTS